jgi:hypothetical protein
MRSSRITHVLVLVFVIMGFSPVRNVHSSGATASPSVPVRMVVTVEAHSGDSPPNVNRDDVIAHQGKDRDQVAGWSLYENNRADLQLFPFIDDGLSQSLGSQLNDLHKVVSSQPATAATGIAYVRNGTA